MGIIDQWGLGDMLRMTRCKGVEFDCEGLRIRR